MRSRWVSLLLITRLPAACVSVGLLLVHHVSEQDAALVVATVSWTAITLVAATHVPVVERSRLAWAVDIGVALALTWVSGDWRSPFYVFGLTALILPATSLPFRAALGWGGAYALGYLAVGILTEIGPRTLQDPIRLETAATHVLVPMMVTLALAYAAALLRQLRAERERSERLAVQAERQRIAWDLHDSAKQRLHAAHLVLSAVARRPRRPTARRRSTRCSASCAPPGATWTPASPSCASPSRAARSTSCCATAPPSCRTAPARGSRSAATCRAWRRSWPRTPTASPPRRSPTRSATPAPSASRCASTTRRAADPRARRRRRHARRARPGGSGLRSMRNRAQTIGAALELGPGPEGRGTAITLTLPPDPGGLT